MCWNGPQNLAEWTWNLLEWNSTWIPSESGGIQMEFHGIPTLWSPEAMEEGKVLRNYVITILYAYKDERPLSTSFLAMRKPCTAIPMYTSKLMCCTAAIMWKYYLRRSSLVTCGRTCENMCRSFIMLWYDSMKERKGFLLKTYLENLHWRSMKTWTPKQIPRTTSTSMKISAMTTALSSTSLQKPARNFTLWILLPLLLINSYIYYCLLDINSIS